MLLLLVMMVMMMMIMIVITMKSSTQLNMCVSMNLYVLQDVYWFYSTS